MSSGQRTTSLPEKRVAADRRLMEAHRLSTVALRPHRHTEVLQLVLMVVQAVHLQAPQAGAGLPESGSLRETPIRTLIQRFASSKATGRLLVDQGTVTSEVFFTDGEATHAKSIHSIYKDRDMTGDSVVVDLLTWTQGDYKFQNGYPAATRTVHSSIEDLFAGKVAAAPPPSSEFAVSPAAPAAPPKLPGTAAPPIPMAARIKVDPDDFSNADDLIGETFSNLIEPSEC